MLWSKTSSKEYGMQMQTLYTKLSRRLLGGLCTVLTTAIVLAGQVQAEPILIFDQGAGAGTLSYSGGNGTLKGTGILFDSIIGLDTAANSGMSLSCVSCFLNFETGANLDNSLPTYEWAGGGYFKLTGTAKDGITTVASGTLLEGTWVGSVSGARQGSLFNVSGFGTDTKHAGLLDFFDLPSVPFSFSNSELSSITSRSGGGFTANVIEADLANMAPTATPEPATILLFGAGLAGLVSYRWRRQTHSVKA
jgi:PEP-CTERM motif